MTENQRLLDQARRFNEKALVEIYNTYSPAIYSYALSLLGDRNLAEDCVGESFSRFLASLRNGGGPTVDIKSYLFRVAHNWITDYYRQHIPIQLPPDLELEAGDDQDPAETARKLEETSQVRAALALLTTDQRYVITLKYMEGWTSEEIAQAMEKPIGAVKALQHRALNSLKRHLKKDA
jgi:RNA polymerase sigma-70 factor, ECF subfamily